MGGGQRQTAGIADGDHHFADLQLIAVAEGSCDQPLGRVLHFKQSQVALVIRPNDGGIIAIAILQHDLELFAATDHMGIGDDVAVFRKDDAAALRGGAAAIGDDAHHRGGALFIDAGGSQKAVFGGIRHIILRLVLLVDLRQVLQLIADGRILIRLRGRLAAPDGGPDAQRPHQQDDHPHGDEEVLQAAAFPGAGGALAVVAPVILVIPVVVAVIAAVSHAVSPPGRQRGPPAMW